MESCLNAANHDGYAIYEVWCHPDDTAGLLSGGLSRVNGVEARAWLVDRLAFADQLRVILMDRGDYSWAGAGAS